MSRYIPEDFNGSTMPFGISIEHLDGVGWWKAPRPRRWHRCWAQTRGRHNGRPVERCACGAVRLGDSGPWSERNSRR